MAIRSDINVVEKVLALPSYIILPLSAKTRLKKIEVCKLKTFIKHKIWEKCENVSDI